MSWTLFLNGTVGVGKTTTAQAVSQALEGRVPHAVIDTDTLRTRWPAPSGDPFDLELELRNLAALSANYRAAGSIGLIVSGVIEDRDTAKRYVEAISSGNSDVKFVLVRLTAPLDVIARRIEARHHDSQEDRDWHLARAPELDAILSSAGFDEVLVNTHRPLNEVVEELLALVVPTSEALAA